MVNETPAVRCFVAVELPAPARTLLGQAQRRLSPGYEATAKWADPAGVHLTLHFLGAVAAVRLPEIEAALAVAVRGQRPFHLQTGELGAFPSFIRPRVLWVGLRGDLDRLQALKAAVDAALAPLGFAAEERAFTPHLTLARARPAAAPAELRALGERLRSTAWTASAGVPVESIALMRSDLSPRGATYSALAVLALAG